MKNKNLRNKGFTLVELVVVLVILAVVATIATPLILSLVNKAKASANKRSVDAYGKAVELSVLSYLMDNGKYPSDLTTLEVEYTGKVVNCNVMNLNSDGSIYLSECSVAGIEVKDNKTEDGWYHYGTLEVITYDIYNIGDQVTYNGIEFYVIENSDETKDSVTLLKAEPLTVDEVNTYGVGHINNYVRDSIGTAYNQNGYGGMVYYSSETCGYPPGSSYATHEGCTSDYANSEVKYVVDNWCSAKLDTEDLKIDDLGYKGRLITFEELTTNLGYNANEMFQEAATYQIEKSTNGETPVWVYNSNYNYWTMSPFEMYDRDIYLWEVIGSHGFLYVFFNGTSIMSGYSNVVRPVITLYKSAL